MKDEKRITKVTKFKIVKPLNMANLSTQDFGKMLSDIRYRFWRLANMAVCENYLRFYQQCRSEKDYTKEQFEDSKVKNLNRRLRKMLIDEKRATSEELNKYSRDGAVSTYITGSFEHLKLKALKSKSKWREILSGNSQLPLFKKDLAMPINCSDNQPRLIEKTENGDYAVDLRVCQKPYPRVLLSTKKLSGGEKAILDRLVENKENSLSGYRHRFFELKKKGKYWFLYVIYDFPRSQKISPSDVVVGVDVGYSVPLYAAINNGYRRIGYKKLNSLGNCIKQLQKKVVGQRISVSRCGQSDICRATNRSGHGLKRRLLPAEKLRNKIDNAYTTLNHQLSDCVIDFAKANNAKLIQMEDLHGLKNKLSGTFLYGRWRYYQLQQFIEYKADEAGIKVKKVNPCYTSRRCSKCGYIWKEFDSKYRSAGHPKFKCPECNYEENADYNAARNLSLENIETIIKNQCEKQGLEYKEAKERCSLKN